MTDFCDIKGFESNAMDSAFTEGDVVQTPGDIFDLARAFLLISAMSHKKLQKLCYYAKAWYLALNDTNLVFEDFEAWVHGAVQPKLYQRYRSFGFQDIPMESKSKGISEEFISFAREVYNSYGCFSGDELERINHREYPWIKARGTLLPWENCSTVISEDDMKCYYRSLIK